MSTRDTLIDSWLGQVFPSAEVELRALAGDASLRRYFRARIDAVEYVIMDSPPEHASVEDFVRITKCLQDADVAVPDIIAVDNRQGFLVLSDLGQVHYLDQLAKDNADYLYRAAFETLSRMQTAETQRLPVYDHRLLSEEIGLFEPWFIERHLGLELSKTQKRALNSASHHLVDLALRQPRCFVHRDYHSRNLMVRAETRPGVLDYQDATDGPITYDLVSLLRDVYIVWPQEKVYDWAREFFEMAVENQRVSCSFDTFREWFDLMGVQRHLKVAGIFCRLFYRDGKAGYLKDIPVTLNYLFEICAEYPKLHELSGLLNDLNLLQRLNDANAKVGVT